ncbi:putative ABC transporter ATP-binding protein YknY [bioreactor metagenome]|jgi:putative ABC transport system ATP-binding protein|uniref:Putative ABC transport system ATP-binding protein n=2 Tax=root TaxID=1 RepID=A0A562J9I0_9FIRM|nr:ABC transporter ATP-binding protein [Sedimentibacter saalensis]MEA5095794.1 ABC transporter ATP-binding protein [Sedimentibacter saalensis]TWH79851.1 putative ABC transport system ATP-binding protein [Sedimentibacter saalensis]
MEIIKMENISKLYKSGQIQVEALKDISFTILEKEFVSIMGPSGSGKSTLLNLVGCLDHSTSGTYELSGTMVDRLSDSKMSDIRNMFIGFVFQNFHLLPRMNAIKNVEIPLIYRGMNTKMRKELAENALELVGLKERMHHLPSQLSGGQQQRVAIARAIVGNPAIILADEPTGALDTKTGDMIMELFVELNEKKSMTIVQVTHEEEIAEYGSRIIRLVDGEIVSDVSSGGKSNV